MLRKSLFLLVALALVFGCSRKDDDELPARSGDLEVRLIVEDEFGVLPDTVNIPLILSIYSDEAHTRLQRSEFATVKNHTMSTVLFEELAPDFFFLSVRINVAGLPEQCPDFSVYVQEGMVSPTSLITIDVRATEIRCTN